MIDAEAGRNAIDLDELERLAAQLRTTVVDLVSGADPSTPSSGEGAAPARRAISSQFGRAASQDTRWGTRVGTVWFPWVVAGYGPYKSEHIESYFHDAEAEYPEEVEDAFQRLQADIAERASRGEEVPYDSDDFKLLRFHVSSRTRRYEEPKLILHFGRTTYFRMLATDQRVDVPLTAGGRTFTLREKYAADVDLRVAPVPELATHWGVGLGVVTSDRRLLVSERGNTAVDPRVLFPSVAEGATRAFDSSENGAPDHFHAAVRGMEEELGVDLLPEELIWLSFGANSYLCEYALIGRVDTRYSVAEIEARRALGAAKDSWETRVVHAIPFDPKEVAEFCCGEGRRFSAFALIVLTHTLMSEFGVAKVEAAFSSARVTVTQQLPSWLVSREV
jgi:hypothetical protein